MCPLSTVYISTAYPAMKRITNFLIQSIQKFHKNSRGDSSLVLVIDRRTAESGHLGARLYAFKPPTNGTEKFQEHDYYMRIHHAFASKTCILPGMPDEMFTDIGLADSLEGHMFGLSYHVYAEDDMACYWSRHGRVNRLRAGDMRKEWPQYFVKPTRMDRTELLALDKLHPRDARFKKFQEFVRN